MIIIGPSIRPKFFGGGAVPLLDTYSGASVAYSVRLLSSTYTGSAIRVRRSSDNAEQDIGFDGSGNLDESALTTFIGAGNGFVTTWYDQSGNGRNATQSTASNQPQIVSSGSVILQNGKASLQFDGTNDLLTTSNASDWNFLHQSGFYSNFGVTRCGNTSNPDNLQPIWGNTITTTQNGSYFAYDDRSLVSRNNALIQVIGNSTQIVCSNLVNNYQSANVQFLHTLFANPNNTTAADRSQIASNGGAFQKYNIVTNTPSTSNAQRALSIGSAPNASNVFSFFLQGTMQEQIFYNSNQSSNRTGIETNINTYYGIY